MKIEQDGDVDISGNIVIDGSGTVGGSALTSDKRLKSNIIDSPYGLKQVLNLNPKMYEKYKSIKRLNSLGKEIGFIAQDVREELPELVKKGKDENEILSLNYNALIPILTKAIKEQQDIIDNLKNKLNSFYLENQDIKERLMRLEKNSNN